MLDLITRKTFKGLDQNMKTKMMPLALAIAGCTLAGSASAEWGTTAYARVGVGANVDGGGLICYGNGGGMGARVGRIGDECDTYAEVGLFNNDLWSNNEARFGTMIMGAVRSHETGDAYQQTNGQGNDYQDDEGSADSDGPWKGLSLSLRQLYGFAAMDDYTVWAGKRYYKRVDVFHQNFFYVNTAGYGTGIEDIDMFGAKGAFAIMAGYDDDVAPNGDEDLGVNGNSFLQHLGFDFALEQIELGEGSSLDLRAIYRVTNPTEGQDENGTLEDNQGLMLHSQWTYNLDGGFNKLGLQAGFEGLSENIGEHRNFAGQSISASTIWEGYGIRAYNWGTFDLTDRVVLGYSFMAGMMDATNTNVYGPVGDAVGDCGAEIVCVSGRDLDRESMFISAVVTPMYFWTDTMSTLVEFGLYSDTADEKQRGSETSTDSNDLAKITIAQQWQAGKGFLTRPAIRLYATHYMGSVVEDREAAEKDAGRDNKANTTVGAQLEIWW